MTRRWRVLLCSGTLILAVTALTLLWLASPERSKVSLTTVVRLAPGMSEAEVADILGRPTADLTGTSKLPAGARCLEYAGEQAIARVHFDPEGRMVSCQPEIRVVTGLERIRLRLNWW